MGCGGLVMLWGTVACLVAAGVWWLATGRVPHELWEAFLVCCGFFLFDWIVSSIESWWNGSKETAKTVQELSERVEEIEQTIRAMQKQVKTIDEHLTQFKSEFDEFAESILGNARQGLGRLKAIEETVRDLDPK